jgi:hypothetical protein
MVKVRGSVPSNGTAQVGKLFAIDLCTSRQKSATR